MFGEHPGQRRVVTGHHIEAAGATQFAQFSESAVGDHRHPRRHRDGELVVPRQSGERTDRPDEIVLAMSASTNGRGSAAAWPHQTPSPRERNSANAIKWLPAAAAFRYRVHRHSTW